MLDFLSPLLYAGIGFAPLQAAVPAGDFWEVLIRQVPNITAFLVLVIVFLRAMAERDKRHEQLIVNTNEVIRAATMQLGSVESTVRQTTQTIEKQFDVIDRNSRVIDRVKQTLDRLDT